MPGMRNQSGNRSNELNLKFQIEPLLASQGFFFLSNAVLRNTGSIINAAKLAYGQNADSWDLTVNTCPRWFSRVPVFISFDPWKEKKPFDYSCIHQSPDDSQTNFESSGLLV